MPQITFWTSENMGLFWEYVRSLLTTAAPGVMIWVAMISVGLLLGIIVKAWTHSSRDQDDDDYDVKHY